jgi:anti-sigma-K factor RskA
MNQDQYTELCELYAVGSLDAGERLEFENHLAGCQDCRAGLAQAMELNEMIFTAASPIKPRPQLRTRVLAGFGQPVKERTPFFGWAFAFAAVAALVIAYFAWNAEHIARISRDVELARLREIQQILQSSTTKQVTFGPQPAAPHGTLFIEQKLGIILIADGLATPQPGQTYESWVIPKNGAPIPIEAFTASQGRGISLLRSPLPISDLKAIAVSLEPANVPVTKPTKVIFAAPLG